MSNPCKLPTGRWQIKFYKDGKRFKASFETQREAKAALDDARQRVRRGEFIEPKKIPTLREVAADWKNGKQGYRYSSLAAWSVHLDNHILPRLGDWRLDRIDVVAVEKLRDDLRAALSPQTINKVLTTLAAVFKFAMRRKLCRDNPAAIAERARVGAGALSMTPDDDERVGERTVDPSDCLNTTEIAALLDNASEGFYRTILMMAALTGMRSGELLGLQWGDLQLPSGPDAEGKVFVRRSLSWGRDNPEDKHLSPRFYEPKTKSGKREIPIPAALALQLKAWRLRGRQSELDLIFSAPDGSPFHRSVLNKRGLWPALKRAKLRRVSFHSLRHSHASALFAAGASVPEVCARLGHRDPSVTMKVYAHFIPMRDSGASVRVANAVLAEMRQPSDAAAIADRPRTAPESGLEWDRERKSA